MALLYNSNIMPQFVGIINDLKHHIEAQAYDSHTVQLLREVSSIFGLKCALHSQNPMSPTIWPHIHAFVSCARNGLQSSGINFRVRLAILNSVHSVLDLLESIAASGPSRLILDTISSIASCTLQAWSKFTISSEFAICAPIIIRILEKVITNPLSQSCRVPAIILAECLDYLLILHVNASSDPTIASAARESLERCIRYITTNIARRDNRSETAGSFWMEAEWALISTLHSFCDFLGALDRPFFSDIGVSIHDKSHSAQSVSYVSCSTLAFCQNPLDTPFITMSTKEILPIMAQCVEAYPPLTPSLVPLGLMLPFSLPMVVNTSDATNSKAAAQAHFVTREIRVPFIAQQDAGWHTGDFSRLAISEIQVSSILLSPRLFSPDLFAYILGQDAKYTSSLIESSLNNRKSFVESQSNDGNDHRIERLSPYHVLVDEKYEKIPLSSISTSAMDSILNLLTSTLCLLFSMALTPSTTNADVSNSYKSGDHNSNSNSNCYNPPVNGVPSPVFVRSLLLVLSSRVHPLMMWMADASGYSPGQLCDLQRKFSSVSLPEDLQQIFHALTQRTGIYGKVPHQSAKGPIIHLDVTSLTFPQQPLFSKILAITAGYLQNRTIREYMLPQFRNFVLSVLIPTLSFPSRIAYTLAIYFGREVYEEVMLKVMHMQDHRDQLPFLIISEWRKEHTRLHPELMKEFAPTASDDAASRDPTLVKKVKTYLQNLEESEILSLLASSTITDSSAFNLSDRVELHIRALECCLSQCTSLESSIIYQYSEVLAQNKASGSISTEIHNNTMDAAINHVLRNEKDSLSSGFLDVGKRSISRLLTGAPTAATFQRDIGAILSKFKFDSHDANVMQFLLTNFLPGSILWNLCYSTLLFLHELSSLSEFNVWMLLTNDLSIRGGSDNLFSAVLHTCASVSAQAAFVQSTPNSLFPPVEQFSEQEILLSTINDFLGKHTPSLEKQDSGAVEPPQLPSQSTEEAVAPIASHSDETQVCHEEIEVQSDAVKNSATHDQLHGSVAPLVLPVVIPRCLRLLSNNILTNILDSTLPSSAIGAQEKVDELSTLLKKQGDFLRMLRAWGSYFNSNPVSAMNMLQESGFLSAFFNLKGRLMSIMDGTPERDHLGNLPNELLDRIYSVTLISSYAKLLGLSLKAVGEYLSHGTSSFDNIKRNMHAHAMLNMFSDLPLVDLLRLYLITFRLPGEAQQIDRILQAFAEYAFSVCKDRLVLKSVETTYILSFAIIMLNTDLHNQAIKPERRMTREKFIALNETYDRLSDEGPISAAFLGSIYDSIKDHPILSPVQTYSSFLPVSPAFFDKFDQTTAADTLHQLLRNFENVEARKQQIPPISNAKFVGGVLGIKGLCPASEESCNNEQVGTAEDGDLSNQSMANALGLMNFYMPNESSPSISMFRDLHYLMLPSRQKHLRNDAASTGNDGPINIDNAEQIRLVTLEAGKKALFHEIWHPLSTFFLDSFLASFDTKQSIPSNSPRRDFYRYRDRISRRVGEFVAHIPFVGGTRFFRNEHRESSDQHTLTQENKEYIMKNLIKQGIRPNFELLSTLSRTSWTQTNSPWQFKRCLLGRGSSDTLLSHTMNEQRYDQSKRESPYYIPPGVCTMSKLLHTSRLPPPFQTFTAAEVPRDSTGDNIFSDLSRKSLLYLGPGESYLATTWFRATAYLNRLMELLQHASALNELHCLDFVVSALCDIVAPSLSDSVHINTQWSPHSPVVVHSTSSGRTPMTQSPRSEIAGHGFTEVRSNFEKSSHSASERHSAPVSPFVYIRHPGTLVHSHVGSPVSTSLLGREKVSLTPGAEVSLTKKPSLPRINSSSTLSHLATSSSPFSIHGKQDGLLHSRTVELGHESSISSTGNKYKLPIHRSQFRPVVRESLQLETPLLHVPGSTQPLLHKFDQNPCSQLAFSCILTLADHFAFGDHLSIEAIDLYVSLLLRCFERGYVHVPDLSSITTNSNFVRELFTTICQATKDHTPGRLNALGSAIDPSAVDRLQTTSPPESLASVSDAADHNAMTQDDDHQTSQNTPRLPRSPENQSPISPTLSNASPTPLINPPLPTNVPEFWQGVSKFGIKPLDHLTIFSSEMSRLVASYTLKNAFLRSQRFTTNALGTRQLNERIDARAFQDVAVAPSAVEPESTSSTTENTSGPSEANREASHGSNESGFTSSLWSWFFGPSIKQEVPCGSKEHLPTISQGGSIATPGLGFAKTRLGIEGATPLRIRVPGAGFPETSYELQMLLEDKPLDYGSDANLHDIVQHFLTILTAWYGNAKFEEADSKDIKAQTDSNPSSAVAPPSNTAEVAQSNVVGTDQGATSSGRKLLRAGPLVRQLAKYLLHTANLSPTKLNALLNALSVEALGYKFYLDAELEATIFNQRVFEESERNRFAQNSAMTQSNGEGIHPNAECNSKATSPNSNTFANSISKISFGTNLYPVLSIQGILLMSSVTKHETFLSHTIDHLLHNAFMTLREDASHTIIQATESKLQKIRLGMWKEFRQLSTQNPIFRIPIWYGGYYSQLLHILSTTNAAVGSVRFAIAQFFLITSRLMRFAIRLHVVFCSIQYRDHSVIAWMDTELTNLANFAKFVLEGMWILLHASIETSSVVALYITQFFREVFFDVAESMELQELQQLFLSPLDRSSTNKTMDDFQNFCGDIAFASFLEMTSGMPSAVPLETLLTSAKALDSPNNLIMLYQNVFDLSSKMLSNAAINSPKSDETHLSIHQLLFCIMGLINGMNGTLFRQSGVETDSYALSISKESTEVGSDNMKIQASTVCGDSSDRDAQIVEGLTDGVFFGFLEGFVHAFDSCIADEQCSPHVLPRGVHSYLSILVPTLLTLVQSTPSNRTFGSGIAETKSVSSSALELFSILDSHLSAHNTLQVIRFGHYFSDQSPKGIAAKLQLESHKESLRKLIFISANYLPANFQPVSFPESISGLLMTWKYILLALTEKHPSLFHSSSFWLQNLNLTQTPGKEINGSAMSLESQILQPRWHHALTVDPSQVSPDKISHLLKGLLENIPSDEWLLLRYFANLSEILSIHCLSALQSLQRLRTLTSTGILKRLQDKLHLTHTESTGESASPIASPSPIEAQSSESNSMPSEPRPTQSGSFWSYLGLSGPFSMNSSPNSTQSKLHIVLQGIVQKYCTVLDKLVQTTTLRIEYPILMRFLEESVVIMDAIHSLLSSNKPYYDPKTDVLCSNSSDSLSSDIVKCQIAQMAYSLALPFHLEMSYHHLSQRVIEELRVVTDSIAPIKGLLNSVSEQTRMFLLSSSPLLILLGLRNSVEETYVLPVR